MIEHLRQLHEVQKLDTLIGGYAGERERLDDGSEFREQLATCEVELSTERDKLTALETDLRDAELTLKATEDERKQFRDKLYSGSIISPKELSDVQMKIEELTNRKGDLEERGLVLMDEVEEQSGVVDTLSAQADELRAQAEAAEERCRKETERLTRLVDDLTATRDEAIQSVDPSLVRKYERLRETHNNLALVRVDTDVCLGCHTQITSHVLKRLANPETAILCDSCNRILYLPAAKAAEGDEDGAEPDDAEES